ncbi:hypothetical protein EV182_000342 [Spiromyces aspiralis]|uniref:Uncharacterized protein n=1 Tax=Spiromyces aspiralis TaxID=68401 RepID=A0ACC1HJH0_9FUNG|nr:hypothetical protein EV182_000342 [Spiromyces aspiralis]
MDATDTKKRQRRQSVMIVRIKRKRSESALDALLLQQATTSPKRQRDTTGAQPVDGDDSAGASARPSLFRLAETVSEDAFDDAEKRRMLQERISSLARSKRDIPERASRTDELAMEGSNDRPGVMQARPDISTSTPSMKYRVVGKRCLSSLFEDSDHDDDDDDKSPKVRRRDLGPDIGGFELLDAVREDYEAAATARTNKGLATQKADLNAMENDEIMCNFVPMLREFLNVQEQESTKFNQDRRLKNDTSNTGADCNSEYVYDIYYADASYVPDEALIRSTNVASLSLCFRKLRDRLWADEETEFLADDNDRDDGYNDLSDDSNAESYYANSYPDEDIAYQFADQLSSHDDSDTDHSEGYARHRPGFGGFGEASDFDDNDSDYAKFG